VRRHSALEDGCGGPAPCQGRAPDRVPVCGLVHGELGGQHRQQDHPQWIPVPGHGVAVPHHLHRGVPPAAAARVGSPQSGAAQRLLPVVHPAAGFREVLRVCDGALQHMESSGFLRAHR